VTAVKKKSDEPPKSKLERAAARADDYVAKELVGVMKDLRSIARAGQDERSRVSAAAKLLDWARPKKPMQVGVQVNLPRIDSRLGLPAAPPTQAEVRMLGPVPQKVIDIPKIHPETAPELASKRDQRRPFRRYEIEPEEAGAPPELPERSPEPRAPDKPPPARGVKPF
jgi:hypothetical protein